MADRNENGGAGYPLDKIGAPKRDIQFALEGNGDFELTEQDKEQIAKLLEHAREAQNNPMVSGYHVRAVIADAEGNWGRGGNLEVPNHTYAHNHGETAALSDFIQRHGPEVLIRYLGFYTDGASKVTPCGNCRDVLASHIDMDNGIGFSGSPDSAISVVRLKNFYCDKFKLCKEGADDDELLKTASESLERAYSPYAKPETTCYGAAIRMKDGAVHSARGFTNAGYHNTRALPATIAGIKASAIDGVIPESIILSVTGQTPSVDYASRQDLEEYRAGLAAVLKNPDIHVPIFIYWTDDKGKIKVYKTDTKEWLPLPFTAANFGVDDKLADSFRKAFLK